jgi:LacI family transcriptional regulator
VVLPDLHGEFFSEIVRGMDRETSGRGYHLLLSNMHADAELAAQAMRSMRGRVDGLIVMAPQIDAAGLDEALPAGIPAMLINSPDSGGRAAMRIDNRGGIDAIVRHLLAGGRRALVHIAGPAGNIDARERREAFQASMARHAPGQPARVVEGNFREEAGERAVIDLLNRGETVDGIVAANDMMALGALQALKEAGLDVPDAVAVAGFDDIPLARYMGLTTVRVHLTDMGARAVARLIDALEDGETGTAGDATQWVTPELVVRTTTERIEG